MKQYRPGPYYRELWLGYKGGYKAPFTAHRTRFGVELHDADNYGVLSLTLRGNSKQRRQQVRYALRYMNN